MDDIPWNPAISASSGCETKPITVVRLSSSRPGGSSPENTPFSIESQLSGYSPFSVLSTSPGTLKLSDSRQSPFHRSLPNLYESPFAAKETGSGRDSSSGIRRTSRHFLLSDLSDGPRVESMDTACDIGSNIVGSIIAEQVKRCKPLARKQFVVSDDETNSLSSGSFPCPNRKRACRRAAYGKRVKATEPSSYTAPQNGDDDSGSVSSGEELQRFFNCMGLDDATAAAKLSASQRSTSRGFPISQQISDDGMDSDEEPLESVSIIGGIVNRGCRDNNLSLIPSVETDDDEPESQTGNSVMPLTTVFPEAAPPRKPDQTSLPVVSTRTDEAIKLRNARIYKWLGACKSITQG